MTFKFNLNKTLDFISNYVGILVFVFVVFMCTNFFWWMSKPAKLNVIHNVLQDDFNNHVSQNIINRAPFGVVIKKADTVEEKPSDNIVLSGIYAAGKDNSIAFITFNGTSMIAKIGDTIGSSKLTEILPDKIVLSNGDSKQNIAMSAGDATKNDVPIQQNNNTQTDNNYQSNNQSQNQNDSYQQNNSHSQSITNDDIIAQRKKMLEQFQKQNSDNNQNN